MRAAPRRAALIFLADTEESYHTSFSGAKRGPACTETEKKIGAKQASPLLRKRARMDATDLALIPRVVRDKLDRAAVKIHLAEWQALTLEERRELDEMSCTRPEEIAQFRDRLDALVWQRCGQHPRRIA